MKTLLIFFLFLVFTHSGSFAQKNYTDYLVNDKSLYSGVYEGNLPVSIGSELYETGFGTIAFYYDGESLKCVYDGVKIDYNALSDNIINSITYIEGDIFKFVKDKENNEGFLCYYNEYTENGGDNFVFSFLKKTGGAELAKSIYQDAITEIDEFKNFETEFRKAIANKNKNFFEKIINLPFEDKRHGWDKPNVILKKNELKNLIDQMLKTELNGAGFKYQSADKNFSGLYSITGDKMFFYFKKIKEEFKMVCITGVFG